MIQITDSAYQGLGVSKLLWPYEHWCVVIHSVLPPRQGGVTILNYPDNTSPKSQEATHDTVPEEQYPTWLPFNTYSKNPTRKVVKLKYFGTSFHISQNLPPPLSKEGKTKISNVQYTPSFLRSKVANSFPADEAVPRFIKHLVHPKENLCKYTQQLHNPIRIFNSRYPICGNGHENKIKKCNPIRHRQELSFLEEELRSCI